MRDRCTMTPESPDEWRAVNEAIGWDDRKMLAGAYQDAGGHLADLSEDVYAGLIAVAQLGALIAYRHGCEDEARS